MNVVSIQVAQLARNHGYNGEVLSFYHEKPTRIALQGVVWDDGPRNINDKTSEFYDENCYSAPEHAQLEEWFRIKYNIHVLVIPTIEGYQGIALTRQDLITIEEGDATYSDHFDVDWNDYYDAYNHAFEQAFKNLK